MLEVAAYKTEGGFLHRVMSVLSEPGEQISLLLVVVEFSHWFHLLFFSVENPKTFLEVCRTVMSVNPKCFSR